MKLSDPNNFQRSDPKLNNFRRSDLESGWVAPMTATSLYSTAKQEFNYDLAL